MAYSKNIREEELKNLIAKDWFSSYDTTHILGDIDFSVAVPKEDDDTNNEIEFLLWAEAKKGNSSIENSLAQLILTIGKARTFEKHLPPKFIGAFDANGITFLPYEAIQEVFYQNDFNWNVTPSDYSTKEFQQVANLVKQAFAKEFYSYDFDEGRKELTRFIKTNFRLDKKRISRIRISKNNFVVIYQKWLKTVRPTIDVNWEEAKKQGVLDSDFYLADILSSKNKTITDKLQVLLRETFYELGRKTSAMGLFTSSQAKFNDGQVAHAQFWNRYDRPPKEEYWDYIIKRKDLLVPQDIRERQGSYFTPQQWVELSQQYLEEELGENWQDEYYIWDCAAGTGNLLNGLTNKYNIWASTLNQGDVDVMKERINNGANLLESHVFQFDFLNDSFDKLPEGLRDIINDPEKRRKLVVYINPPYAEAATTKQKTGTGANKANVATNSLIYNKYKSLLGIAGRELFVQFLMRVYIEIPNSIIANFSTLKILKAPNFKDFRRNFRASVGRNFIVPASTFDNVSGNFPIGFFIWHLDTTIPPFEETTTDIYNSSGNFIGTKTIAAYDQIETINDWIIKTRKYKPITPIGFMSAKGCDFQNANNVFIINSKEQLPHPRGTIITTMNIAEIAIYFSVRKIITPTWVNDRDQFIHPNSLWKLDATFQNDCLAYVLFENRISSFAGINHWIPFTEAEVNARDCFESHFMSDYISGRKRPKEEATIFSGAVQNNEPLVFSPEATAVMDAGRELWKYYHSQADSNPNASLYDIKMYFQGTKTDKSGKVKMKSDSDDAHYTMLMRNLRNALKVLAKRIEPKIYEYGFLK